ncbi:MAG: hypothetical protein ABI230_02245 [Aestuariivirga sp.]
MSDKMKPSIGKSQSQSDKFKAMAKELEADGDEKAFDKVLKAVSPAKKNSASKN